MIAILKKNGQYGPAIICDYCGQVIDDALNANAVSSAAPKDAMAQVFHVHKGACDQALSAKLGGSLGSEELSTHLLELMRNALANSDFEGLRNLLRWSAE